MQMSMLMLLEYQYKIYY